MRRARKPSAFTHGLTSLYAREQLKEEAKELAECLLIGMPRTLKVIEAARAAAESILYLRQVQKWRLHQIESNALNSMPYTDSERSRALLLSTEVKSSRSVICNERHRTAIDADCVPDLDALMVFILVVELSGQRKDLRRLNDYEQRAISARRDAIRQFDYERIEAESRYTTDPADLFRTSVV